MKRDTNWRATRQLTSASARSVELLGNEADQVRGGALHALVWLADSTPRYKQTVLDVLCAYLRRPFTHPSYTRRADDLNR